ncbi:hypothetical protein M8J77_005630 [Diaphorina citri]|nr:hypothetical protein M8J77_005630 [Diaphorina citri]
MKRKACGYAVGGVRGGSRGRPARRFGPPGSERIARATRGPSAGARRLRHPITEFLNQAQAGRRPGASSFVARGRVAFVARSAGRASTQVGELIPERDPIRGPRQAGSSTGAVHLSKNNAGVLRSAQRGQKPRPEQKGKSRLDLDVQHA